MPAKKRQASVDESGPSSSASNSKTTSTIPSKKPKSSLPSLKEELKQINQTKQSYQSELYQILKKYNVSGFAAIPETDDTEGHTWTNPGLISKNRQKFLNIFEEFRPNFLLFFF